MNIKYPPSFIEYLSEHPNSKMITAVDDIKKIQKITGEGLLPFLVFPEGQSDPAKYDYYCFDLSKNAPDYKVVVFSIHAIVKEWSNFSEWIEWSSDKILDIK